MRKEKRKRVLGIIQFEIPDEHSSIAGHQYIRYVLNAGTSMGCWLLVCWFPAREVSKYFACTDQLGMLVCMWTRMLSSGCWYDLSKTTTELLAYRLLAYSHSTLLVNQLHQLHFA